jgi:hypothetical protein
MITKRRKRREKETTVTKNQQEMAQQRGRTLFMLTHEGVFHCLRRKKEGGCRL